MGISCSVMATGREVSSQRVRGRSQGSGADDGPACRVSDARDWTTDCAIFCLLKRDGLIGAVVYDTVPVYSDTVMEHKSEYSPYLTALSLNLLRLMYCDCTQWKDVEKGHTEEIEGSLPYCVLYRDANLNRNLNGTVSERLSDFYPIQVPLLCPSLPLTLFPLSFSQPLLSLLLSPFPPSTSSPSSTYAYIAGSCTQ